MLQLKNVSFAYSDVPVIRNIELSLDKGEILSIIGASGSGKSTLLEIIYGLHQAEGDIRWEGKKLLGPDFHLVPGEEFMKYLSQDFDLMPPLSVADNVGKFLSNMFPGRKKRRISELLEMVEMQDLSSTKVKHLSGGQQQRVALARVLARPPEILLLDEPFSHIDQFRRGKLRRNLFTFLRTHSITCLIATHDSTEALSFADKTLVMREGQIVATGPPVTIFNNPPDYYVASLFGEVNQLPLKLLFPDQSDSGTLLLYPHEIRLASAGHPVRVKNCYFRGSHYLVQAVLEKTEFFFEHRTALEINEPIQVNFPAELIQSRRISRP